MANYDYKCNNCNEIVTISKPMAEYSRKEFCEKCESELQRVFTPIPNQWKCGGAYVTDNK